MESTIKWQTGEINDDGYYLVTNREGRVYVLCHRKGSIFSYSLESVIAWCPLSDIEPYKEETMEEIKVDIPKGYEFAGVDDDNQQVVFTKIQPQYPKTYEECCEVLGYKLVGETVIGYDAKLITSFQRLKVCRDAYWKIAGEEMELGEPWEPDFKDDSDKYFICYLKDEIWKSNIRDCNRFLVFPTEKIRDEFYENFKELIERCKKLL